MLFHPEYRPDPSIVGPVILKELSKTGFKQTRGISAAIFENLQSMDGLGETATSEQRIVPRGELLTEKWTVRRAAGLREEISGLYVGPLAVIRFHRAKLPLIGDLFPFHLWNSSRITNFVVEEVDKFPSAKGGKLRAKVTYEDHYADGELQQTENRQLQCEVINVVGAATILAGLSGPAARIQCHEELEPDGRTVGVKNPQTWSEDRITYTHWYIMDNQWSIPSEGEITVRLLGSESIRKWTSRVVAFKRDVQ
jgi:hypothetical protein